MAEVDWAEWAIEAADGFRETKWQNIGVALRQLAHELIDTRARLSTAETEREHLKGELVKMVYDWHDQLQRADLAEARVEAAEQALLLADRLADRVEREDAGADDWGRWHQLVAYRDARAALACPPQQRGE